MRLLPAAPLICLLSACSPSSNQSAKAPTLVQAPAGTRIADGALSAANIALEPVKPAEIVVLALQELGLPGTADQVVVRGALRNVLLKDGTLRFATPGDTGSDQHASIALQHGSAVTTLQVLIRSQRPSRPLAHAERNEDGGVTRPQVQLAVGGLGPNNTIGQQPLTFKLVGAAPLDLAKDSVALAIGVGNVQVPIHKFWQFKPADNSFVVPAAVMPQLLAALPNGALELMLNFVSKDGEFAESYDMLAVKQGATLRGTLQTTQGLPVTSLAGRRMLLQGYDKRLRADAVVDANGGFTFEGVIPDTYQLTLDDLEAPNVVSASAAIFAGTTAANITLTYAAPVAAAAGASVVSSSVTQNGAPPPAR